MFSAPHLKCSLFGRLDTTVDIPRSLSSRAFASITSTVWSFESSATTTWSLSFG